MQVPEPRFEAQPESPEQKAIAVSPIFQDASGFVGSRTKMRLLDYDISNDEMFIGAVFRMLEDSEVGPHR